MTGLIALMFLSMAGMARAQGSTYSAPPTKNSRLSPEEAVNWINTTHLWIPDDVGILRGAIVQYNNKFDPSLQALARAHGFALITVNNYYFNTLDLEESVNFKKDLQWYATQSGHAEIVYLPFIFTGWSKGGQVAYAFNAVMPERTIAFIANKGPFYFAPSSAAAQKTPSILVAVNWMIR